MVNDKITIFRGPDIGKLSLLWGTIVKIVMSDSTTDGKMAQFLKTHPRLLGVLFGLMVLLSQAGAATAGLCSSCGGP